MGETAVERLPSLRRDQVSGCAAGVRGGASVSRGEVELPGAGMGPHQDGRSRCARRHRQGAPDPGLAGDERRTGSNGFRKIFLSPEPWDPDPSTKDVERQGLLLDLCRGFQGPLFRNRSLFLDPVR